MQVYVIYMEPINSVFCTYINRYQTLNENTSRKNTIFEPQN